MVEFRMPSLGADMEAGTLVEWLVKPGDWVKRGDVVAVVETQKGAIEIETFQAGQIEQILVDLKSKVPVGTPLARIRTELEAKPGAVAAPPPAAPPVAPAVAPLARPPCSRHRRYRRVPRGAAAPRRGRRLLHGGSPRTRHRPFNSHRQRAGRRDHLCRRRAPSRRGRRSAGGKEAPWA